MTTLREFHDELDKTAFEATHVDELHKKLKVVSEHLHKNRDEKQLHMLDIENQVYALQKSFEYDNVKKTFKGISWQISGTNRNEAGEEIPMVWPDITQFEQEDFEHLESRYKESKNLYEKTEFGLVLYFQKPTPFAKHNSFKLQLCAELFELANIYLSKITDVPTDHYASHMLRTIKAAFSIAIACKSKDQTTAIGKWLFELHQSWSLDRNDTLKVLLGITHIFIVEFRIAKIEIDINAVINLNLKAADIQAKKYIWGAMYLVDACAELDNKAELNIIEYRKKKAELYEALADEAEGTPRQLAAISFVESALRLYREIKDNDNVKRLEERYQKIRGTGHFSETKSVLDREHVQSIMDSIEKDIAQNSPIQILQTFATGPMFSSLEVVKYTADEDMRTNFSLSLFPTSISDKFGNTIARFTTDEEKKQYAFWQAYDYHFQVGAQWLTYYFIQGLKSGKISLDATVEFLSETWLNQPILRTYAGQVIEIRPMDILLPPIKFLFSEFNNWIADQAYDFNNVVLNDSLTLKIEALLRYMCERINIATFKSREGNIVMEKLLDDLLADIQNKEDNPTGFQEDDRIFIKFVLSEKAGQNLRNRVAHGLLDIYEYRIENAIVVFQIILRFAKYQLINNPPNESKTE